jgi:hypothetical protein
VGRQLNVSSSSSGARDAVLCAGCIVCLVCYGGVFATVLLCYCVCVCPTRCWQGISHVLALRSGCCKAGGCIAPSVCAWFFKLFEAGTLRACLCSSSAYCWICLLDCLYTRLPSKQQCLTAARCTLGVILFAAWWACESLCVSLVVDTILYGVCCCVVLCCGAPCIIERPLSTGCTPTM